MEINNHSKIINLIIKSRKNSNGLFFVANAMIIFTFLFSSCNPSKRVQKGDFLLMSNHIELITSEDSLAPSKKELKRIIDKEELSNLLRQVPNRKFLGVTRMYLGFYNMISPKKLERDIKKKHIKHEEKNIKRIAKGKDEKEYKMPLRDW